MKAILCKKKKVLAAKKNLELKEIKLFRLFWKRPNNGKKKQKNQLKFLIVKFLNLWTGEISWVMTLHLHSEIKVDVVHVIQFHSSKLLKQDWDLNMEKMYHFYHLKWWWLAIIWMKAAMEDGLILISLWLKMVILFQKNALHTFQGQKETNAQIIVNVHQLQRFKKVSSLEEDGVILQKKLWWKKF